MNLHTILHADAFENEKDFLKTEIEKNISGKLDAYIRPHLSENNDSVRIEAFFDRSKTGFDGKLILTLPDTTLRASRENFSKLDDLVSHLFTHLKTQFAKNKIPVWDFIFCELFQSLRELPVTLSRFYQLLQS